MMTHFHALRRKTSGYSLENTIPRQAQAASPAAKKPQTSHWHNIDASNPQTHKLEFVTHQVITRRGAMRLAIIAPSLATGSWQSKRPFRLPWRLGGLNRRTFLAGGVSNRCWFYDELSRRCVAIFHLRRKWIIGNTNYTHW
ncbi:MAG: hypothetical protein LBR88_05690 [Zoogloeaceae bacterium]|nr:hypothetical protein [Zoogloeaceae bacterium]